MGGWKTKSEEVVRTVATSPRGVEGEALSSEFTMMFGQRSTGAIDMTQTPRDVSIYDAPVPNPGDVEEDGTRMTTVGSLVNPRFAMNTAIIRVPSDRVRISLHVRHSTISSATGMILTNPDYFVTPTGSPAADGVGAVFVNQGGLTLEGHWQGSSVSFDYSGSNPTATHWLLGMEILGTEINVYHYHYTEPDDFTTLQQIYDRDFIYDGSPTYSTPLAYPLYLGATLLLAGTTAAGFKVEYLKKDGNPPGEGAPFPFNQYGLFKSQLTLHGLLNNAKTGDL